MCLSQIANRNENCFIKRSLLVVKLSVKFLEHLRFGIHSLNSINLFSSSPSASRSLFLAFPFFGLNKKIGSSRDSFVSELLIDLPSSVQYLRSFLFRSTVVCFSSDELSAILFIYLILYRLGRENQSFEFLFLFSSASFGKMIALLRYFLK